MDILVGKAVVEVILWVASSIFKYRGEIYKVKADRRDRIAKYFLDISETIGEAADEIEKSGRPSGACQSMRVFADKLPDTIKDFVPLSEAQEYGAKLKAAYNLEQNNPNSKEERDKIVSELRGASGIFRALGYDMRARSAGPAI
jgi:hypothetical protein